MKYWFAIFTIIASTTAFAEEPAQAGLWSRVQVSLSNTWDSEKYELYIPINTWHNRSYYTDEKIDSYNEQPWGLGVGKYRFDDDGDWHGLYAMVFQDSHNDAEPVAGYAFQHMWRPTEALHLGLGYTLGATIRKDLHYVPLPVIAPVASVTYKKLALQSTYILGGEGNGNILFTSLRWQLE